MPLTYTPTAQPVAYQAQPVAYQTGAVAVHSPSVGLTQQSVTRSLGGGQSLSTYSKAVDSAYSSVRKFDTRFTNDALAYAPAQVKFEDCSVVCAKKTDFLNVGFLLGPFGS